MKTIAAILFITLALSQGKLLSQSPEEQQGLLTGENPYIINNIAVDDIKEKTAVSGLDTEAYAGYVQVKDSGSSMYYIMYPAQEPKSDNTPLLLWLQGGPGCSSWTGNLNELGPYSVDANGKLSPREYTWNQNYHVMFIDNPFGAGYSYATDETDYPTDEDEVAENLHFTLQTFFQKYPDYAKLDFYIFGESYAGHYIPSIGKYILEQNEAKAYNINLKAIAIGDGWTDPINQLTTYGDYAFANGMVDEKQLSKVQAYQNQGIQNIKDGKWTDALSDFDYVLTEIISDAGNVNEYNYRDFGSYPDYQSPYLNTDDIKTMYHAPQFVKYQDCGGAAYSALSVDFMHSMAFKFPYILERIPVMLYNGQDDLIVNTPGAEDWIKNMPWDGIKGYLQADRQVWKNPKGEVAGYVRSYKNLVQVIVLKAGHMVPMDQIYNSQDMVTNFIEFASKEGCNECPYCAKKQWS